MIGIFLAAKQDLQDVIPQAQSQNAQQQVQPGNWFDTGDFVNGNEPLLQRGRQYPELMEAPMMYQQQQQQIQQQQPVMQPVGQQVPVKQMQPAVQNVVPQSQSVQPQQVVQPVQQQPVQQPIQHPIQQAQQPAQIQQQQPARPRPTVEKPPTYDYESNPPPRRKPGSGQQRPVQSQQGQMQGNPQQTMNAQKPQSVQGQKVVSNVQGPPQQAGTRNSETLGIQQVKPSGRHQAVSGKKGKGYEPPGTNQAQIQGPPMNGGSQVQPNQGNQRKPNADNLRQQTVVPQQTQQPQQPQQQQQPKGYYTESGFIPATNNNMNNRPGGNQRNQNNPYRNLFNKDRYGYQYQNPLYGAQRPYGRQYDNYDYNNYAYGEAPSSNYNYEYNSGTIRSIFLVLSLYFLRVEFKVNMM